MTKTVCDGCGKENADSNHVWRIDRQAYESYPKWMQHVDVNIHLGHQRLTGTSVDLCEVCMSDLILAIVRNRFESAVRLERSAAIHRAIDALTRLVHL